MNAPRVRLGELLVRAGLISPAQLEEALAAQKRDGRRLGTLLVESGLVSEAQVTQILSQQLSVPWVSLHHIDFSEQLLRLVPRDIVERYCLVPIYVRRVRGLGDALYVAMDDPTSQEALEAVARNAGLHVRPMIAPPDAIRQAIRDNYGVREAPEEESALQPYGLMDDDEGTQTNPRRKLMSVEDVDDDDTVVRWRREIVDDDEEPAPPTRNYARVDSVVDLEDTSDVLEIPRDDFGLAPVDDSVLTETTGTLSIDDPDVVEVSGPVRMPAAEPPTEPGAEDDRPSPIEAALAAEAPPLHDDAEDDADALPLVRAPSRPANPLPSSPASQPAPSAPRSVPPGLRRSAPPSAEAEGAPAPPATSPSATPPPRPASPPPPRPSRPAPATPAPPPPPSRPAPASPAPPPPTPSRPAPASSSVTASVPRPATRPPGSMPSSSLPQVPRSAPSVPGAPPPSRPAPSEPGRAPPSGRSISVTLLDGTTINLPRPGASAPQAQGAEALSIRDVIAALRAAGRGVDASDVLGDRARWEKMFAALLAVLVRKGLLTEAEFLEELDKG